MGRGASDGVGGKRWGRGQVTGWHARVQVVKVVVVAHDRVACEGAGGKGSGGGTQWGQ